MIKLRKHKEFVKLVYPDEHTIVKGCQALQKVRQPIYEIYTPCPVPELEEVMQVRYTRIPTAGFIIGAVVGVSVLGFLTWMMGVSYQLNFGGKPYVPLPSFVPPLFESIVLTTAYGMAIIMFIASTLKPWGNRHPVDPRISDDAFVVLVDRAEADLELVKQIAEQTGAKEITILRTRKL